MADFDGEILSFDEDGEGFFNLDNYGDKLEAEKREANYLAELDEIEHLRKWLRNQHATKQMTYVRMREGLNRLNAKMESVERRHQGNEIPEPRVTLKKAGPGHGRWRDSPRQQARRDGKTHYFSESICPRKHQSPRYTSTGHCVECVTDWNAQNSYKAQKEWRERKKEEIKTKRLVANRSQD